MAGPTMKILTVRVLYLGHWDGDAADAASDCLTAEQECCSEKLANSMIK